MNPPSTDPRSPLGRLRALVEQPRSGSALVVLAAKGAGMPLAFAVQVAFARWAGPEAYGVYSYALAWTALLTVAARLGVPEASLRFVASYRERGDDARLVGLVRWSRRTVLAAATGLAVACTGAMLLLGPAGRPTATETALLVGFWSLPVLALMYLYVQLGRAAGQIAHAYVLPGVLRPLLMLGGAAAVFVSVGTLTGPALVAVAGASALPVWLLLHRRFRRVLPPGRRTAVYERRAWREVALPLLWVSGMIVVLNQADLLMIGLLLGTEEVGFYRAATRTADVVGLGLVALNAVAVPRFAALHAVGDRAALQALLSRLAPWYFWPTLAAAALVAAASGLILAVFGPAFGAAQPALLLLALVPLAAAATGPVGALLAVTGHQRRCARVYTACALLNVALNLAGIHLVGLTGAALATLASLGVWNVWLYRIVRRHLALQPSYAAQRLEARS